MKVKFILDDCDILTKNKEYDVLFKERYEEIVCDDGCMLIINSEDDYFWEVVE